MLKQKLQSDQIAALKTGDKFTLSVLRYIIAQLKYREIEKQSELTDDEVVQVLRKHVKQLQESAQSARAANRPEVVEENEKQIEVIRKYLPAELSDDELESEIQKLADDNRDKILANPKAIIGIAMGVLKAKADPARIQAALKKMQMV